jgi:hypothetical protein
MAENYFMENPAQDSTRLPLDDCVGNQGMIMKCCLCTVPLVDGKKVFVCVYIVNLLPQGGIGITKAC